MNVAGYLAEPKNGELVTTYYLEIKKEECCQFIEFIKRLVYTEVKRKHFSKWNKDRIKDFCLPL